jgi:hypothetical protein
VGDLPTGGILSANSLSDRGFLVASLAVGTELLTDRIAAAQQETPPRGRVFRVQLASEELLGSLQPGSNAWINKNQ